MIVPQLKKVLKVKFIAQDVNDFFMNLIDQAVDYRVKNNIVREDFLNYLGTLAQKKGFTNADLAGHSITFFSDGLETSSISIAFTLYELAKNAEVQEKLRNEINEVYQTHGELSLDALLGMPYLDQVLNGRFNASLS
jgi:cytochrome P450 family 6